MEELPEDLSKGLKIARLVTLAMSLGLLVFAGFSVFLMFSGSDAFGGDLNTNYMRLGFYAFGIVGFVVAKYVTDLLKRPEKLTEDNDNNQDSDLSTVTSNLFSSTVVGLGIGEGVGFFGIFISMMSQGIVDLILALVVSGGFFVAFFPTRADWEQTCREAITE